MLRDARMAAMTVSTAAFLFDRQGPERAEILWFAFIKRCILSLMASALNYLTNDDQNLIIALAAALYGRHRDAWTHGKDLRGCVLGHA